MVRTQVQLPDALYTRVKRLAEAQEWSLAEAVRRGLEQLLARYPEVPRADWTLPVVDVGDIVAPPERLRELAQELDDLD